jgi:predicted outer membrane repeat protein
MKHLDGIAEISGSSFHNNTTLDLSAGWGGAILVFDGADVTINNGVIKDNLAGYGGAIYLYSAQETDLELDNSTMSGNSGTNGGGAIYANTTNVVQMARVDIFTTTISGNYTGAAGSVGGGIANVAGRLVVINSVLYSNSAQNNPNTSGATYGGGIYNSGFVALRNVTLSQNYSRSSGGGLYNSGTAEITNATFYRHCCGFSGGAGIRNDGAATLKNTIIVLGGSNTNCGGAALSGSFNLSNDGTCGFGAGHDNVDPLLAALAYNGGPTATHLPSSNPQSPAIDAGQCTDMNGFPVPDDQRGYARPYGAGCDVGAVEVGLLPALWLPLILR